MRPIDRIMLALLVVDGVVIGVLSLSFAYLRFGGVALDLGFLILVFVLSILQSIVAGLLLRT